MGCCRRSSSVDPHRYGRFPLDVNSRMFRLLLMGMVCSLLGACSAAAPHSIPSLPTPLPYTASLPVHDPTHLMLIEGNLTFLTSGMRGAGLNQYVLDANTGKFEQGPSLFRRDKPTWVSEIQVWNASGEFDAPDRPGPDELYFTVFDEIPGRIQDAIGRAVRVESNGEHIWRDDGIVIRSVGEAEHPRAMDASVFTDFAGLRWMVFGSYAGGIYLVQLDPDTGKLREHPEEPWTSPGRMHHPERFIHLASYGGDSAEENAIEAAYIYPHDGHYYLFVNWDGCCQGVLSTYNIRVGRSVAPQGPYRDKAGVPLQGGGGTLLLDTEGRFIGPGHAGVFPYRRGGTKRYLFTFHYYDGDDYGDPKLGGRELRWDAKGWPVLGDHVILPE